MRRKLEPFIQKDLDSKIVLLSGPRQVGKTTLSKALYPENFDYLNIDNPQHRLNVQKYIWKKDAELVIFDELHKLKNWKRLVKGIYDTEGVRPRILVTGSARMDAFRKGGDSLAGRFYSYRLHPFSVAELKGQLPSEEVFDRILRHGGFPEPFLADDATAADRWRRAHTDRILREDLLDLTSVRDLKGIETLAELLRQAVGSPVSFESLSRDLQISSHTVKRWIGILESLYVIFIVTPYSKNIARGLLKQPKIYFYDTGFISADKPAARFENAVACALLKHLHFLEDTRGKKTALYYVRDRNKKEVDFLTLKDGKPEFLIETKLSGEDVSQLNYFFKNFPSETKKILLLKNIHKETDIGRIQVRKTSRWLEDLESA